jgi:hypothetical protein
MTHSPALVISAYVRWNYSTPYLHLFYTLSFTTIVIACSISNSFSFILKSMQHVTTCSLESGLDYFWRPTHEKTCGNIRPSPSKLCSWRRFCKVTSLRSMFPYKHSPLEQARISASLSCEDTRTHLAQSYASISDRSMRGESLNDTAGGGECVETLRSIFLIPSACVRTNFRSGPASIREEAVVPIRTKVS